MDVLARKAAGAQSKTASQLERTIWSQRVDPVLLSFMETLPEAARVTIKGKYDRGEYGADPVEGRKAYINEVMESYHRTKLAAARKEWETKDLPAMVKERLGETIGQESSPELQTGAAPRGAMSQQEFDKVRNDTDYLYNPENWKRFEAGRAQGLITH